MDHQTTYHLDETGQLWEVSVVQGIFYQQIISYLILYIWNISIVYQLMKPGRVK